MLLIILEYLLNSLLKLMEIKYFFPILEAIPDILMKELAVALWLDHYIYLLLLGKSYNVVLYLHNLLEEE